MASVGEEFPKEQARVRELLEEYKAIGPAGAFGAMMLEQALRRADAAAISEEAQAICDDLNSQKKVKANGHSNTKPTPELIELQKDLESVKELLTAQMAADYPLDSIVLVNLRYGQVRPTRARVVGHSVYSYAFVRVQLLKTKPNSHRPCRDVIPQDIVGFEHVGAEKKG